MADVKISGLPASSVPLAGTEVLPIVQGGQTRQVSVNNLTTGKAVSATQYTSTIVTGTAPLVVASTTEVANLRAANATSADTANQVKSNATTGVLQIAGPTTATTRVMTTPDANFTAARIDAGQTFTGNQTLNGNLALNASASGTPLDVRSNVSATTGVQDIAVFLAISSGSTDGAYAGAISVYSKNSNGNYWRAGVGAANSALGSNNADLTLYYGGAGNALVEGARLRTTGDFNLNTGNLVIGTSGKGIDFSATAGTGTSELLDDYEEGTFTPTVIGETTAGTATYTNAQARYTKIGNAVTITIWCQWTSGTGTGFLNIGGLPFPVDGNNNSITPCAVGWAQGLTVSANNSVFAVANASSSVIRMLQAATGGGATSQMTYNAAGYINLSCTYYST